MFCAQTNFVTMNNLNVIFHVSEVFVAAPSPQLESLSSSSRRLYVRYTSTSCMFDMYLK